MISLVHGLAPGWLGLLVALPLVVIRPSWLAIKFLVTVVHELGHAAITLVTPGRVRRVRVYADGSAATDSVADEDGAPGVLFLVAGYPTPSLLGLAGLIAAERGWATWALGAAAVSLLFLLGLIRNLLGAGVLLTLLGGVSLALWQAPAQPRGLLVWVLAWLLLLGAVRDARGQYDERECSDPYHGVATGYFCPDCNPCDAQSLSAISAPPFEVWRAGFLLISVLAAGAGVWLLTR